MNTRKQSIEEGFTSHKPYEITTKGGNLLKTSTDMQKTGILEQLRIEEEEEKRVEVPQ